MVYFFPEPNKTNIIFRINCRPSPSQSNHFCLGNSQFYIKNLIILVIIFLVSCNFMCENHHKRFNGKEKYLVNKIAICFLYCNNPRFKKNMHMCRRLYVTIFNARFLSCLPVNIEKVKTKKLKWYLALGRWTLKLESARQNGFTKLHR